ncbi:hypothetical protein SHKM778_52070 [Streptomyces sp. KM77-8]|uniref:Carbohydrate kinase PfkB domain-containing protein n=1 Tax=Streptomyces haneummycinicus TaxID=3074435 RepID=A0AAT9HP25_9ACTN
MTTALLPAEGHVVCVGETMAALAPDPPGPLEHAGRLRLAVAGAESNVAMYLAGHGIPAVWLSALGDDPSAAASVPRSPRPASTCRTSTPIPGIPPG